MRKEAICILLLLLVYLTAGKPTSNPKAAVLHIIQEQIKKFVQCIFKKEGCTSCKAFPVSLKTFSVQLLSDTKGDKHLHEEI